MKIKTTWLVISLLVGAFVATGLYLLLLPSWEVATFIAFPVTTVCVLLLNPLYWYRRAFYSILTAFLVLNKFFFTGSVDTSPIKVEFGSGHLPASVNITLLILAGICLILHFLNTREKLKGTILHIKIKKNKVGDINGDNNTIIQS